MTLFHRLDFRSLLAKLPPELGVTAGEVNASAELTLFGDGEVAAINRKHLETAKYEAHNNARAIGVVSGST